MAARTGKGFGAAGKTGSFFLRRKEKAFFFRVGKREVFRPEEQEGFLSSMRMRPNPLNRCRMRAGEPPLVPERCALRRRFLRPVSRPFRKIRKRPGIAAGLLRASCTRGLMPVLQKNHKYSAIGG
ncbi:hypothetical protein B4135_2866 [Caldibacillus debilis]|uniref:Uncharacterized protein n=1 Tax=Caldibacillus debilis TaxID=301148 RepID=A0A150LQW3_9BACI|nr:hypothetical protein B4135_2866 [Caldibacillus debilis]